MDEPRLTAWASDLLHAGPEANRVPGVVTAPGPTDIGELPAPGSEEHRRLEQAGLAALARGELALVVLAGGMATRMGGVVKALVEALPGVTFLDARLAEREHWQSVSGATLPMWLMTSHATDGPIRDALDGRLDGDALATFRQGVSLRLTPEGGLFLEDDGNPSVHATGHGDLPDALRASGLLHRFVERGGRYVWIMNLDNLGAAVDPVLLGWHIQQGVPLTVEVVDAAGDVGGIPARLDGRPVVLEQFRLPAGFEGDRVPYFNTNTFIADASALDGLEAAWSWFRVEKTVDGRPAIQFERLVGELTSFMDSRFVRVPRDGDASRFLPAKSWEELERSRAQIAARVGPFLAQNRDAS
ncbi:MAG TPA: UTP--glucose-1-phosphate uridylyltransferase [Gaiellales bacterium]|nr:UTP--glucose-1-phosphate uridylyltransferase [Gaiellales bacterium]